MKMIHFFGEIFLFWRVWFCCLKISEIFSTLCLQVYASGSFLVDELNDHRHSSKVMFGQVKNAG